ncbi:DUF6765 family protein [Burkholderia lata]|uniref:Uncharacterized protein n=1 Tax=Burkholderia lata (strain ATCC 17760 / DSM 23089 / LMG 22485 / NCIMB 9086 / R18194 / 383) TaxID=482957 RepID=A0A6P2SRZ4_BURL3|nr:DUF6765 family protein [Burkholderia lata]VWC53278.1 hypothetical protein BLA18109_00448 [Burkholderia lata]
MRSSQVARGPSREAAATGRAGARGRARRNPCVAALALLAALAMPLTCSGFEADVHFGLTFWLARQAGFAPGEADAIALADQRMDAGSIEYMTSPLQFACLSRFAPDAQDAQSAHYPGETRVPAAAAARVVVPDSPASRSLVDVTLRRAEGRNAGFMLGEFGRALHALQDAWAHQGTPSVPDWRRYGIDCDAGLAMAAPVERGGPAGHAAEMTWRWPVDTEAMAKSTYLQMIRYPKIDDAPRNALPWEQVRPMLAGFIDARTKHAKSGWFVANGVKDTSFLDGTSLPDGPAWQAVRWHGRRDVPKPASPGAQSGVDKGLVDFYARFFDDWVTTSPVDKRWLPALAAGRTGKPDGLLVGRLTGWRLRDHGAYLAIEAPSQPTASASAILRNRASFAVFKSLNDAVLPLVVEGDKPSPILPFLVFPLPASADGNKRAVALIKLLDAPYDTIGVIAEQGSGAGWKVRGLISSSDY